MSAKLLSVLALAALVSACATTPPPIDDVDYVAVAKAERSAKLAGAQLVWVRMPRKSESGGRATD